MRHAEGGMSGIRAETSVDIERPPADVFAVLADVARLPEWQTGCVDVELESEGALSVGSRFRQRVVFAGRHATQLVEVQELEPDRLLTLRVLSGPLRLQARHALEPVDAGTRLSVVMEGQLGGIGRLAGGLVRRGAEHQFRTWFRRLKALVESETPPLKAS